MFLYSFEEIFYQVTGEYQNDIRIIFMEQATMHLIVYDMGCFYLVNKPSQINLEGYSRFNIEKNTPLGFKSLFKNVSAAEKKKYAIQQIYEVGHKATYIELDNAVIKIGMHFYTGDGQMVTDFWFCNQENNPAMYEEWLAEKANANQLEIIDFRLI